MAFFHNLVTILSSGIKMYQISFQGQKINKEMFRDEKCTLPTIYQHMLSTLCTLYHHVHPPQMPCQHKWAILIK